MGKKGPKRKDYTGEVYGGRELVEFAYSDKSGNQYYYTICVDCKEDRRVDGLNHLRKIKTKARCPICTRKGLEKEIGNVYGCR